MVDARDLKSLGAKVLCRFESGRPHQCNQALALKWLLGSPNVFMGCVRNMSAPEPQRGYKKELTRENNFSCSAVRWGLILSTPQIERCDEMRLKTTGVVCGVCGSSNGAQQSSHRTRLSATHRDVCTG